MMTETSEVRSQSMCCAKARKSLAPPHRRRRAFTLLEVIVVIGIIVLLTALTVTVAVGVNRRSEVRETENTLKLLDLALSEWTQEADRIISWGFNEPGAPTFDIYNDTPQEYDGSGGFSMLNIVLNRLNQNPASQSVLRQIAPKFFERIEDEDDPSIVRLEVRDAWEKLIYVIHPGRVADTRTYNVDIRFTDEDGTIRVSHSGINNAKSHPAVQNFGQSWEGRLGVCKNRRICFVSAGPDGQFGDLSADVNSDDYKAAEDNIYSYPVDKP